MSTSDHTTPKQLSLFDPIEIPLTQGYTTLVSPEDSDLAQFKWYALFSGNTQVYAARQVRVHPAGKQHKQLMHRIILERIIHRSLIGNEECDHINNDGLCNIRQNIRLANRSQQTQNTRTHSNNTSGYKGVHHHKSGGWVAEITVSRRRIYLGYFDTPEEAYAAYCEAALKYHGEFARLK